MAERGAIRGGRDNVSDREVSGEENRAIDIVGTGDGGGVGGGVDDAQPGKPGDDSRLAGGVVAEAVDGAGKADGGLSDRSARLSAQNKPRLSAQPQPANPFGAISYEKTKWKRSRIKKGQLIKRLTGYSIAETEYGVSYLWVLSRKPDRTSADNSVHGMAGYYNWKALAESGLLRKEKKAR